jgi:membrane protease YdiL (CAAX protease family)
MLPAEAPAALSADIPPPPRADAPPAPIAHWAHTAAILAGFFLVAGFSALHARHAAAPGTHSHAAQYASSAAAEWIMLGLTLAGIHRRRAFLRKAFLNRAHSWAASFGLGLAVYCLGTMLLVVIGGALYFTPLFHRRNEAVVLNMLPHTPLALLAWFFVSLSAGVCEELIFRGYLLQQVTAWTGRPVIAVVLTGMLFGSLHLYEGAAAVLPLMALGILFGEVARRLHGDLRAVIIAHTLQDFLVALLALVRAYLLAHQPHGTSLG